MLCSDIDVQVGAHICRDPRGSWRTTVAPFEPLHSFIFFITSHHISIFVYLASPKDSIIPKRRIDVE
jgi:hypothetical protein